MKSKNVFIATLPRSGSTLLGMMLGSHSQICHIGESAYWSKIDVQSALCCCGKIGCPSLLEISRIISNFPKEIKAISMACGIIDSTDEPNKIRHSLSLSSPISDEAKLIPTLQLSCRGLGIISNAARTVFGRDIVVENSKYISIAETLLDQDENWKVIILTRDPRGIASSNKESGKRKNVPRPVKDKIDLFLSFAKRSAKMIQRDRTILIRYEDLCRNPIATIGNLCEFLEVPFENRVLEFKRNKGHLLMGNHMMHDSNQSIQEDCHWHDLLNEEERSLFMKDEFIQAFEQIGYDLRKVP